MQPNIRLNKKAKINNEFNNEHVFEINYENQNSIDSILIDNDNDILIWISNNNSKK